MGKTKALASSENTATPSFAPAAAEIPHIPSPFLIIRRDHPQLLSAGKTKQNRSSPAYLRKSFVHMHCSATKPHHQFCFLSPHPSICPTTGEYPDSPSSISKGRGSCSPLVSKLVTSFLPETKTSLNTKVPQSKEQYF